MIVAETIVSPREEVTRRPDAIDYAGPTVARLHAVIVRVAEEESLSFTDGLVKAVAFRVKGVRARVSADVIVPPLRIARLVRQRVELQISFRDRANKIGWNNIARKRVALNATTYLFCRERVEDLEA